MAALRDVERYREAIALREGLRSWRFFDFEPRLIRHGASPWDSFSVASPDPFVLSEDGRNLPEALNWLGREHPERLRRLADDFSDVLPHAERVGTELSLSGEALIQLHERGLTDPLTQADLSDGTLRILALLFLVHHPRPPALVAIEEPETGLYPRLIEALLDVLRSLSERVQVMFTTHSVTLLNRLVPEELVFVHRGDSGSSFERVGSRADVQALAPGTSGATSR